MSDIERRARLVEHRVALWKSPRWWATIGLAWAGGLAFVGLLVWGAPFWASALTALAVVPIQWYVATAVDHSEVADRGE